MKSLLIAICLLTNVFTATPKKETLLDLTYKWRITWFSFASFAREIENFPPAEKQAFQHKLKKAFIRFKQNGSYAMRVFETKDEGTWKSKNKELILNSKQGGEVKFKIQQITARQLKLYNVRKSDTLFMLIKR